jgi:hypothetical protein
MTRRGYRLLVAALFLCISRRSSAQPTASDDATAQARVHFERGVQLYREGSLNSALAEFTRAHQLSHNYRILYNVARLQAERHDYARTIETFTEYLRQGGSSIPADRRSVVDNELARLRQRVAELRVSANVPGGEVWIGDRQAGRLPLSAPILVNTGSCVVRVTSPGYRAVTRELDVAGGDRLRVELELERDAAPKPVRDNTWLWVSLAATGTFAAGSAVFGVLANEANDTLEARLNTYPTDPARIDDARATARMRALGCDLLAGAAVVGAGASFYLLLNPSYRTSTKSEPSAQGLSTRLAPSLTGLILNGSF